MFLLLKCKDQVYRLGESIVRKHLKQTNLKMIVVRWFFLTKESYTDALIFLIIFVFFLSNHRMYNIKIVAQKKWEEGIMRKRKNNFLVQSSMLMTFSYLNIMLWEIHFWLVILIIQTWRNILGRQEFLKRRKGIQLK